MRDHASFGYRIRETAEGWAWSTLDSTGRVQARGQAPNKSIAAACVIRALARSALPDEARSAA